MQTTERAEGLCCDGERRCMRWSAWCVQRAGAPSRSMFGIRVILRHSEMRPEKESFLDRFFLPLRHAKSIALYLAFR
jgi:hypothetical protein